MKWFKFEYVKKRPYMFAGIVIVFGLLFWFMFRGGSKGSTASSGTTVVTAGKSDAAMAMEMQMGMAQMQANVAMAQINAGLAGQSYQGDVALQLAQIEAAYKGQELGASKAIAEAGIASQNYAMTLAYQGQLASNQFSLDYATLAYDAAADSMKINAQMAQTGMFINAISTLKKKDRDESLQIIGGMLTNNPVSFYNPPGSAIVTGSQSGSYQPSYLSGSIGAALPQTNWAA